MCSLLTTTQSELLTVYVATIPLTFYPNDIAVGLVDLYLKILAVCVFTRYRPEPRSVIHKLVGRLFIAYPVLGNSCYQERLEVL